MRGRMTAYKNPVVGRRDDGSPLYDFSRLEAVPEYVPPPPIRSENQRPPDPANQVRQEWKGKHYVLPERVGSLKLIGGPWLPQGSRNARVDVKCDCGSRQYSMQASQWASKRTQSCRSCARRMQPSRANLERGQLPLEHGWLRMVGEPFYGDGGEYRVRLRCRCGETSSRRVTKWRSHDRPSSCKPCAGEYAKERAARKSCAS